MSNVHPASIHQLAADAVNIAVYSDVFAFRHQPSTTPKPLAKAVADKSIRLAAPDPHALINPLWPARGYIIRHRTRSFIVAYALPDMAIPTAAGSAVIVLYPESLRDI